MIKKGYVYVIAVALFSAFGQTFRYRFFEMRDLNQSTIAPIILQLLIVFLAFLLPGLFIARWYYKSK
jgi:hypothetical protein